MQIHRAGDQFHYFSRRAIDHGEQSGYTIFDSALKEQISEESYIIDCELVAWNKQK